MCVSGLNSGCTSAAAYVLVAYVLVTNGGWIQSTIVNVTVPGPTSLDDSYEIRLRMASCSKGCEKLKCSGRDGRMERAQRLLKLKQIKSSWGSDLI